MKRMRNGTVKVRVEFVFTADEWAELGKAYTVPGVIEILLKAYGKDELMDEVRRKAERRKADAK
jgi:hypothetical protein